MTGPAPEFPGNQSVLRLCSDITPMPFGLSLPKNQTDILSFKIFCRGSVATFWHYQGGSIVGKVVDGGLRVMGINALRVVDSSVFNFSPGTNPQATLMMLGRYVGLTMLQAR
ncbi:hypothetical protein L3X38_000079 [Prunus dulcis]|uniref:Glucose-methanol-choline oxidoreductase C-terminal domain-containing protein n=1 Tax=Prunus dulcis TaxID=3755 RepID=A0AAD4US64_PRUDU|nr:hypothetical protein L3X38_000079 [Prunus dulcis]